MRPSILLTATDLARVAGPRLLFLRLAFSRAATLSTAALCAALLPAGLDAQAAGPRPERSPSRAPTSCPWTASVCLPTTP
jgi:hypothetical protein